MRIAVLGLGFMGSTHLKALKKIPGAEVVAVMDQDEQRLSGDLSSIQGNIGGPGERFDFSRARRYRTIEEVTADPDVEAVDICLPTHLHAPAALAALSHGKHVLVEKPMALDEAACEAMIAEARKRQRILMVAQVLRFVPAYRSLAGLVKEGKLGTVRSAIFRRRCAAPTWGPWEFDASKSGGGVFDLLIHDADMCLHLFGPPEAVSATGHEDLPKGIDTILARLEYPGIGFVVITGGWHHVGEYPFSMEYTVVADKGTVEYSSAGEGAVLYPAGGAREALPSNGADWYQAEIEYFLECCGKGAWPELCPPEESAAAVRLTRLMVESRRRGGERLAFGA
ncbi:MAG: Gfo/Idh/MocA family protein [Bryobacteraceae bacterium]